MQPQNQSKPLAADWRKLVFRFVSEGARVAMKVFVSWADGACVVVDGC